MAGYRRDDPGPTRMLRSSINHANQVGNMLRGKNAIVTGSSSGIGLGIAKCFAEAGINVLMNGIEDADQVIGMVRYASTPR